MHHSLDLLENATDSLNEALRKYLAGNEGDSRAYKFAVLHFSHALELLFKYHVSQAHPLLLYRNPFSQKIEKGTEPTIGIWEAVQFLKNQGNSFDPDFLKDLEWVKKLRNEIEHYKFDMDVREVRSALGRIIRAVEEFNSQYGHVDLSDHVDPDCWQAYETLADEYLERKTHARTEAREIADAEDAEVEDCPVCGERETVVASTSSYECKFCGASDERVECFHCEGTFRRDEVSVWNDENLPGIDYICENCDDYIFSRD